MLRLFFVSFSCCVVLCVGYGLDDIEIDLKCGPNQETRWVRPCPPEKTCKNRHIGISCLAVVTYSAPKCVCKDGFFRNDVGDCIPVEQCEPRCPGENEQYTDCKDTCPLEFCSSIGTEYKCNTTHIGPCEEACICKPGYLRRYVGSSCIPMCQCPEMRYSQDCNDV